jgi:hypothetical protein
MKTGVPSRMSGSQWMTDAMVNLARYKDTWKRRRSATARDSTSRKPLTGALQTRSNLRIRNRVTRRYLNAALGDGDILPFAVSSSHALGRGGGADPGLGGGRRPRDAAAVGGGAPGGPEGAVCPPAAAGPATRVHEATPAPGQQLPRRLAAARRGDFAGALVPPGNTW